MTPSRINQLTLYWLHLQYCSITQTVFDIFNMAFNDLSQDSSIFQDRKSFKAADYLCITHYAYQFSSINCFYRNLLLFSTHFKQNYVSARIFSIFQELNSYDLSVYLDPCLLSFWGFLVFPLFYGPLIYFLRVQSYHLFLLDIHTGNHARRMLFPSICCLLLLLNVGIFSTNI